ncbi:hypothetical protein QBL02_06080 [Leucobacter sp. UT-8R-CII-1-4]|uniref:hypothetical protein n=1 Tax=Leucobacter sp. UT-8R-CII-1-4 TaxID=3040075 RepID=UPI0024A940D9|nr:hypothetical protein [Leucobacter sp. UT-8R-CII-1-4]MDI6023110.1 hypothetical protein [Leucobacter sp. UT-8R-CII-1-4]
MHSERLSLNPKIPLSWEEPEILRFGFEHVIARLIEPTPGLQRLLSRLREGIARDQLESLATNYGVSAAQLGQLLSDLGPALQRTPQVEQRNESQPATQQGISVIGRNTAAEQFREHCERAGFRPPKPGEKPKLAILVDHFWVATAHSQALLREQVPHLSVRFTDRAVYVGPMLTPEGDLCQNCIELHALELDPQLRLVAAQLAANTPAALNADTIRHATTLAFTVLRHWQQGTKHLLRHRLRIPVARGVPALRPTRERVKAHKKCPCIELARAQLPITSGAELETGFFDKTGGHAL